MARLDGKTAIVTGGASGFGAGIARKFVAEGARVMIADVNGDGAAAMAKELGPLAIAQQVDGSSDASVNELAGTAIARFGRLDILVNAGIQNAGQTCSASSRILVQRKIHDQLLARMAERYAALRVGPAIADLDLGPMVSERQKEVVNGFLGNLDGAEIAARGAIESDAPAGGHFLQPTLLSGVAPDNRLAQDEIFGPVQVVIPFDTEEEAIAIANGTDFGLVAGIWTSHGGRQMRLAKAIRSGQVFINNYGAGGGVELPFGGTGKSGFGREKGMEALYGFSVLKTVAAWHG
jgi:aldehyde dehydrogenase (NAD+)